MPATPVFNVIVRGLYDRPEYLRPTRRTDLYRKIVSHRIRFVSDSIRFRAIFEKTKSLGHSKLVINVEEKSQRHKSGLIPADDLLG